MNVLALVPAPYDTSPAQRFRIEPWARHWGAEVHVDFAPFADAGLQQILYQPGRYPAKAMAMLRAFARRLALLGGVRRYDVAWVAREAAMFGPPLIERALGWLKVPWVYDLDDPVWMPYRSPTHGWLSCLKCPGKTAVLCHRADAVVAGNRLLADWVGHHASRCHVVPSTVDLGAYPIRPHAPQADRVTLGWTGSHSTLPFLESIRDVLATVARRYPLRLVIVSHRDTHDFGDIPAVVVAQRWDAANEARDLQGIDIGLAPFPDSGWTPWRCHGKVLQYMASGIPCVASAIGILPEYITDGVHGFLAATPQQWVERLSRLIEDAVLRREMGRQARVKVEQCYSASGWAQRVRSILEAACGASPGKDRP